MQRTLMTVLAASLMTLGTGQAKTHDIPDQARRTLQDLEAITFSVASHAEDLDSPTRDPHPSAVDLGDLATVKDQINQAGKELRILESERSSLLPWEEQMLDRVAILMADAARNETEALHFYNQNGSRPLTSEFHVYVKQVRSDAEQAAKLLKENLRHDKEHTFSD